MKAILYNAVQEAPSAEVVEPKVLARFFANFDESFFTFCEKGNALHRGDPNSELVHHWIDKICPIVKCFGSSTTLKIQTEVIVVV